MDSTDFAFGMMMAGMPLGVIVAFVWYHHTNNLEACLWWFLALLLVGGIAGYLFVVPLTGISIYFAMKNREVKKRDGQKSIDS